MASKDKYPDINDYEISWSSVGITLNLDDGESLDGLDIEGLKFDSKIDTSRTGGMGGGRKLRETEGTSDNTASMQLTKSALRTMMSAMAKVAPERDGGVKQIGLVKFNVVANYSTKASPTDIFTTKLIGCRMRSRGEDGKSGSSDAIIASVDLGPMDVIEEINGVEIALL